MSSIYDANFADQTIQLISPDKREPMTLSFLGVFAFEFQYLHDLIFNGYASGNTSPVWDNVSTFVIGNQVIYADNAVYEALMPVPANTPPNQANTFPVGPYWLKIQNIWIGARERSKYSGGKLLLEFALNRWFGTTFRQPAGVSDIFIQNNALTNNAFGVGYTEPFSSAIYSADIYCVDAIIDTYSFATFDFTINVPSGFYTSLGAQADSLIRAIADKYVIAGMTYNIVTY